MRPIVMTNEIIEALCAKFKTNITGTHLTGKTVNINMPIDFTKAADAIMPKVIVTTKAYYKMLALVNNTNEEVAWHGTILRDNMNFTIKDIFMFPQEVTASTATATDDYGAWVNNLADPIFDTMRFHGHSHVNMAVNPSGVDINYQLELTDQVQDFYIFAIYNKRNDFEIWIYDKANNLVYDKADITYLTPESVNKSWAVTEAAKYVTKHVYSAAVTTYPRTVTNTTPTEPLTKDGYGCAIETYSDKCIREAKALQDKLEPNLTKKQLLAKEKKIAGLLRDAQEALARTAIAKANSAKYHHGEISSAQYNRMSTYETIEEYYEAEGILPPSQRVY